MATEGSSGGGIGVIAGVIAGVVALPLILVVLIGGGSDNNPAAAAAGTVPGTGSGALDASKVPADYVQWLTLAGSVCPDKLTAPMLAAQIEAESSFTNPGPNSAGAEGPAQWIPAAWSDYGLDGDGDGTASPRSIPDALMAMATRECADWDRLAAAYPDQPTWPLVLASYNAGPGAVDKFGGVPPYTETQNYVNRIQSRAAYFTAPATATGGAWVHPVKPAILGAGFGQTGSRWSWTGYHTGQDYPVGCGTPIGAIAGGTITEMWALNSPHGTAWGNQIVIDHGVIDGAQVTSTYNHLSAFGDVTVGQKVTAGQQLGFVGATGNVTGCHLHLEVHLAGPGQMWNWGNPQRTDFADPAAWITNHATPVEAPTGQAIADWALTQKGKPYEWGKSGPDSYDCSGLVTQAVLAGVGVELPRTTQQEVVSPLLAIITSDQLAPGDLIFFQLNGGAGDWDHVGIYLGDGKMIHAPRPGKTVEIVDITSGYYAQHTATWRRVRGK